LQKTGPVLEQGRRRSFTLFGNVLAKQPLAPVISSHDSQPCKKLRCAPNDDLTRMMVAPMEAMDINF
ncbi:MAG TPA: hypothetical protein VH280_20630, partial [Verrucomicrobiae bacterium]|nr:hypothetical protein [Verrucomicrobiae bacterium]